MILALNTGFYNTKVRTHNMRNCFPTKVQISETGRRTLVINDIAYEVGNGARCITDKMDNLSHYACTEYSVLKYATGNCDLMVALPMNMYLDRSYREKYNESILGTHAGIVDGESKTVIVDKCTVFAEGAAAYLPYQKALKDSVVGVLDFGGNTINCMVYSYGELLRDTITTLDLGMIKLERTIIDTLNIKKRWNVQEYEVREIIQTGECKEIVGECINDHLKNLKNNLIEKKWNIDRLTIFATGGGSLQLKDSLEGMFNRVLVSDNGLYDNVDGLFMVGGQLYGQKTY